MSAVNIETAFYEIKKGNRLSLKNEARWGFQGLGFLWFPFQFPEHFLAVSRRL